MVAWAAFAGKTIISGLQAASEYKAAKAQYKATKAWQQYRNTMTELSGAMSQNAITTNELLFREASKEQGLQLLQQGLFESARTEVSAAAAGVKGRSVNQTMLDANRELAVRERQQQISVDNAMLSFDQQRLNTAMQVQMNKDYSYIPKPKAATYFLKFASEAMGNASDAGMFG